MIIVDFSHLLLIFVSDWLTRLIWVRANIYVVKLYCYLVLNEVKKYHNTHRLCLYMYNTMILYIIHIFKQIEEANTENCDYIQTKGKIEKYKKLLYT